MRREIQLLTIASLALLFQAERGFACLFGECEDVSGGFTLFTMSSLESSSESSSPSPSPGTDQNFPQGFWTVGFGPLGNPAGTTRIPFTFPSRWRPRYTIRRDASVSRACRRRGPLRWDAR